MSSTSNASLSGSSAAANTVVVTARDIEFSNYNSSTGKWGGAVMTMMILDSVTEDLEGYDEKVYAVFRNHDDPTDLIEFSSEIDGLDTRVTTTDPMVPSAKYELYKIYGETSGGEYATSSQFYFQVPGKEWDFANDTVNHDIELVSDWFNYGYVVTSDDVVHGAPTQQDIINVASGNGSTEGATVTINGETILISDIVKYKMTSLVTGDTNNTVLLRDYKNLQDFDVVSSKITLLYSGRGWTTFNKRFAFPETVQTLGYFFSKTYNFNQHVYVPDSVTKVYSFFGNGNATDKAGFTKKIHFPRNLTQRYGYNFNYLPNWGGSVKDLATNVQLPDSQETHPFAFGYGMDWGAGLENSTYTTPSSWTYVPTRVCNFGLSGGPDGYGSSFNETPYKVVVSEGITAIHNEAMMNSRIIEIKLPSTLTSLPNGFLSGTGTYALSNNAGFIKIDMSACTNITQLPDYSFTASKINISELKLPSSLTTIGDYFLTGEYTNGGFVRTVGFPTDADGVYYAVPNGVTTMGNHCCGNVSQNAKKIILPPTITSVGTHFCFGSFSSTMQNPKIAVLEGISPDAFASSDYSFRSDQTYSQTSQGCWRIYVDPGTADAWAAKFPDIERSDRPGYYWRHIEWVEKPTQYAYVFYETNYYDDTPTKGYVELQSMADFNKLVNGPSAVSDAAVTVDTDDQGNTIELHFGTSSRSSQGTNINTITGVYVGTDITAIPDHFLRSYRFLKKFKWGGNETSIGSYLCYNAGQYLKDGDRTASYDLANIPDTVTTIGTNFFDNAKYLDEEVNIPSSVTTIQDYFMNSCTSFNQPITFPDGITELNYILSSCTSFNQTVTLPNTLTKLHGFLMGCTSYTLPVTLPNTLTELYYFMNNCTSFNQPVTFPNAITNMYSVLFGCTNYTQQITLPSFLEVLGGFLNGCVNYNQPITLPSTIKSCEMLEGCTSYNQPLDLPKNCAYGGVLVNATSFNSVITFVNGGGATGNKNINNFLKGCISFNQPIDLSPLTNIWQTQWCLEGCTAFNSSITFPSAIGSSFGWLNDCTSFNQPLVLPTRIGSNGVYGDMLRNLKSFNQPITIPANWTTARWYNGSSLFKNCDSLTSTVTIEANAPNGTDTRVLQYSFTTTDSSAPCYTAGVTFTGTKAQDWKNVLPDYDGSQATPAGVYRKIIVQPTVTWSLVGSSGVDPNSISFADQSQFENFYQNMSPKPDLDANNNWKIWFDSAQNNQIHYRAGGTWLTMDRTQFKQQSGLNFTETYDAQDWYVEIKRTST